MMAQNEIIGDTQQHFKGSKPILDDEEKKDEDDDEFQMNMYTIKKTVSEGLLDTALIMANASQLKSLLVGEKHRFYYLILVMITLSLILQVATGIMLIYVGSKDINNKKQQRDMDRWNNRVTGCVFLVTVMNIIISVFNIG